MESLRQGELLGCAGPRVRTGLVCSLAGGWLVASRLFEAMFQICFRVGALPRGTGHHCRDVSVGMDLSSIVRVYLIFLPLEANVTLIARASPILDACLSQAQHTMGYEPTMVALERLQAPSRHYHLCVLQSHT